MAISNFRTNTISVWHRHVCSKVWISYYRRVRPCSNGSLNFIHKDQGTAVLVWESELHIGVGYRRGGMRTDLISYSNRVPLWWYETLTRFHTAISYRLGGIKTDLNFMRQRVTAMVVWDSNFAAMGHGHGDSKIWNIHFNRLAWRCGLWCITGWRVGNCDSDGLMLILQWPACGLSVTVRVWCWYCNGRHVAWVWQWASDVDIAMAGMWPVCDSERLMLKLQWPACGLCVTVRVWCWYCNGRHVVWVWQWGSDVDTSMAGMWP